MLPWLQSQEESFLVNKINSNACFVISKVSCHTELLIHFDSLAWKRPRRSRRRVEKTDGFKNMRVEDECDRGRQMQMKGPRENHRGPRAQRGTGDGIKSRVCNGPVTGEGL